MSYISAEAFPAKLLKILNFQDKPHPIHLQFNPTNLCNLNCEFCSCKDVDRNKELSFGEIEREIKKFKELGGLSVTITGGGEPTIHGDIDRIIELMHNLGLKIGMVTNGTLLDRVKNLNLLTWCRISANNGSWRISEEIIKNIKIDWALSYVFCENTKRTQDEVNGLIEFANRNENITHLRIVSDIFNPIYIPKFENDRKVIYQNRQKYVRGAKKCWISMIKPVLDADGYYYPCCGTQYAKFGMSRKMHEDMRMGTTISDIKEPFDGSSCDKCYYWKYNELMEYGFKNYKHTEFV